MYEYTARFIRIFSIFKQGKWYGKLDKEIEERAGETRIRISVFRFQLVDRQKIFHSSLLELCLKIREFRLDISSRGEPNQVIYLKHCKN